MLDSLTIRVLMRWFSLLLAHRITKMSDDELLAAFKDVLQAKLPSNPASSPAGPLSALQQIPARIQEFKLQWPWQQAPPTADSSSVSMLNHLLQKGGSGTTEAATGGSSSEAVDAGPLEAQSSSSEGTLRSTTSVDARPGRLESSLNGPLRGPQSSEPDKTIYNLPSSSNGLQSDQSARQATPEMTARQPEEQSIAAAAPGGSKKLQSGELSGQSAHLWPNSQ